MFTIKVLEDKEFDKLPFKHVKEALGCADPKTKIAYVRNTHWGEASKTINLLTIQHEIDELVSKTSPHDVDGIRYKKGNDIWASIIPAIVGIATGGLGIIPAALAAGGASALTQSQMSSSKKISALPTILSAIGGGLGAGAMAPGVAASKAVGGGYFGQVLSGVQQAVTGGSGALTKLSTDILPKAVGIAASLPAAAGGAAAGGAAAGGAGASMTGASLLSRAASGASAVAPVTTGGFAGAGAGIMKMLDSPMTKLGLSSLALSALPISAPLPAMGSTISKWLTSDTVTKAGEAAKKLADFNYGGEFQVAKETQGYIDVMEKDIRKQYTQRRNDLDRMGLGMSDQFMRSGERLEMMQKLQEEEQGEVDRMKSEWLNNAKQQHSQNQYNYVMQNLQADESTKRDLLYGELADIMAKYNLAQEDIMNFRKLAADAGMYMVQQGMGIK